MPHPVRHRPEVEARRSALPDALANPYLAYAALLMAGLDGIQDKIHPGEAMDKNLYDLPPAELAQVPTVAGSLREALDSLAADHDFLLKGDVFTKDQIESYIELKMHEVMRWEMTPARSNTTCITAADSAPARCHYGERGRKALSFGRSGKVLFSFGFSAPIDLLS
ncbi:hypothetical protein GCM10020258_31900 [Sphingomonas yabuuchiae]